MHPALLKCVSARRASPRDSELELRLGRFSDTFSPGVTRDVFEQLERDLVESPLDADAGWVELVDYHYTLDDGTRARTRVTFDSDRMEIKREHTCKQTECSVLMRRSDESDEEACRLAWALEVPLEVVPEVCLPTHVRIKQRRCFRDVRNGGVVWSYELSKTWSASGRSAVEHLQHVSEPVYEVECELIDERGEYIGARDDEAVAESLMMKAKMLLGEESHGTALEIHAIEDKARRKRRSQTCATDRCTRRR